MSSSVLRCKSSRRMFSHVGCFTMSLCLVPVETVLAKPQLDELVVVERVTYLGPEHKDLGYGVFYDYENFRFEFGSLHCKEGFIPSYSNDVKIPINSSVGPLADGQETVAATRPVQGLFLIKLDSYVRYQHVANMSCFPRSANTYSVASTGVGLTANVPYVAVGNGTAPAAVLPTVSISATAPNASEAGPANGEFLVALNQPIGKNVIVKYRVSGTAKNGKDYKKLSGQTKILAGNVSNIVSVLSRDDKQAEPTETVVIALKPSKKKYQIGTNNSATVEISDND